MRHFKSSVFSLNMKWASIKKKLVINIETVIVTSRVLTTRVITELQSWHCPAEYKEAQINVQSMNCYIHCHTKMPHVQFSRDLTSCQSPVVQVTIKKTNN